jgi:aspartyl-tRNA synthetase
MGWIRGRVTSLRAEGNACFIVVCDDPFHTIQACHFKDKADPEASKALIKFAARLALEMIVDVYGTIVAADVKACTQSNVEIQISKMFVVSRAPTTLPFLLEDAARSQSDIDASQDSERPFAGVASVSHISFSLPCSMRTHHLLWLCYACAYRILV